jgi:hypothetical protein
MYEPHREPGCPKCGLFTDHRTGPDPRPCSYDRLREAVGEVSPTEDKLLHWLAGWDYTTADTLVALFKRLRAASENR